LGSDCVSPIEVRTPDANNSKQIEKAIDKWYRDRALTVFLERYEYCLQLVAPYGINPDREASRNERGFELRTMQKRWGSCTKAGKILRSDSAGVSPLPRLLGNTQSISPDVYGLIDS
jgi:predicted metal-dependent hydrolase